MAESRFSNDDIHEVYAAVGEGDVSCLVRALREGFDPRIHQIYGYSIISRAVEHSWQTLVKVVGVLGYCDIAESVNRSPLMAAISCNDENRCRALLRCGASVEWVDSSRGNCLHWVCCQSLDESREAVTGMIAQSATLHALLAHDLEGHTPITLAVECKCRDALQRFVRRFRELEGPEDLLVGPDREALEYYLRLGAT